MLNYKENNMNRYKYIYAILLIVFATSCEKLQFDDPVTFTIEEALEITPDYYFKVTASAFSSALFYSNDGAYSTTGLGILADQITTTNRNLEWWDFAKEPRIALNPSESYGGRDVIYAPYFYFYQANLNATKAIAGLDAGNIGVDDQGNDRTNEVYAVAHLVKGIAQGYIGATYDRGIIVDEDLGVETPLDYPHSYKELIENAISHFDKAINYANQSSSITLGDFYTNVDADKTLFIKYVNSLSARLLASIPRDKEEAQALGAPFWNRVLQYAEAGVTEDFTTVPYLGSGNYYNYSTYYLASIASGAAYLPLDIKVAHFADNTGTYPDSYPTDNTVLGPVQTDDARFANYFNYYSGFGFLLADRGRHLFSNYGRIRWGVGTSDAAYNQRQVVFLAEETRLLRAEAKFWLGDLTGAAAELNASTARRKSEGGLNDVPATEVVLRYVLHYEYAIEIDVAGGSINPFAFLRRHNLLQPGTPTQFPITENQLKLTTIPIYTFGGISAAGQKGIWGETGTAGNDWGWKGTKVNY